MKLKDALERAERRGYTDVEYPTGARDSIDDLLNMRVVHAVRVRAYDSTTGTITLSDHTTIRVVRG